ncbi:putative disease resistance protein RGA3 isoform X2 [Quercus robur]|nr:putative disease resistance protein RGA3 isoform X2 [Quercus robur]
MVQAMLNKFEERRLRDDAVKLWYDKLEDAYYMIDDVLDTWETAKIKLQIPKEEGEKAAHSNAPAPPEKKMKKVWSSFPSPSCCFRQVDNVSVRHEVGHKIKKLNVTLANILQGKQEFGIDLNSQPERVERLEITSFVDVSKIVGRNEYKDDPLNNLLGVGSQQESNPLVISLVGVGGIGKSTVAKLAYNDSKVRDHFQKLMWVSVSDPFDQCKVAKAIIQELAPTHESLNNTTTTLQALLCIVCDLIKDKKFFLVFDDVWAKDVPKESEKWEPFKDALTHGAQGSRILVTTRNKDAAHMMGSTKTHIINLGNLFVDDCWLIIRKIAFIDENIDQHKDLEPLGRQLADKCHGLPLAAKLIGGYMHEKRIKEQWEKVLESSLWDLEDVEKGLLGPLLLSYYELSSVEKQCFLFCAIFPKDHVINRFELIIHWMAQGYINSKGNREMEDIAEEYFEKLAMSSFFQDFEKDENDGRIKSCKMHDIVHDFAQSLTKDVCFTIEGKEEVKIDFKRARQLSLIVKETFSESIYEAKNLRTLFLHSHVHSEFNMHKSKSFDHFRCLRTLILVGPFTKLPDAVENLIHLRCFHMYGNVKIEELPETLCNLCNLQTLNIDNGAYIKKLPQGMGKLINLRQLRIDTSWHGGHTIKFPNGIGKLTCLRTLSQFYISGKDDKEGCKLGELKNLNQLRGSFKMHGLGNVVDVGEAQNAQLKKKIHLHNLVLNFLGEGQFLQEEELKEEDEESRRRMESDVAVLNALEPPSHLEKLSITRVMSTTVYTDWMTSLTNLKSLNIDGCSQLECLPPLGKLPLLKELEIWGAPNVKKLGDEFLGIESENKSKKDDCHIINIFPNLRVLKISYMKNCEEWIGMGGKREEVEEEKDSGLVSVSHPIIKIMPRLESLTIKGCHKLKCLPDYLRTTPLQKLFISKCPILKQRCKTERGDYLPIISHIPRINLR